MGFLYSVIGFIIAIGILVSIHEFGHYWVAKKLGVKVLKFSVGMGKPLWSKVIGKDQTEFVVAAIPLGGYVRMLGENDPDFDVADDEKHRAFDNQPIWKRSLIILAGPGINFLFAIFLLTLLGLQNEDRLDPVLGDPQPNSALVKAGGKSGDRLLSVNDREIEFLSHQQLYIMNQVLQGEPLNIEVLSGSSKRRLVIETTDIPIYNINPRRMMSQLGLIPQLPPISSEIGVVGDDSPAQRAGIQKGDKIVGINGMVIKSWQQMSEQIAPSQGVELMLDIDRQGNLVQLKVTPEIRDLNGQSRSVIGVGPVVTSYSPEQLVTVDRTLWQAFVHGLDQTWQMSSVTLRMLGKMLTLQVSHQNISGPITIANVAGQAIQIGLDYYIHVLAVISISLGVMNLLPIPILDGGHLLVHLIEGVAGKSAAESFFAVGQRVGVVLLLGFMTLAFYNDILRLLN